MNSAEADAFLYRGDLLRVVELSADADTNRMVFDESMPRQRAEAAVSSRLVLRAATLLEGWAVSLARWTLEAAIAGSALAGGASDYLSTCAGALRPTPEELLSHARQHGQVWRANISRAIGQCASHHHMWHTLADRTLAAHAPSNGLNEHTRLYWNPLHFAAAFSSPDVMAELLTLAPPDALFRGNGVGFPPLHVAVVHESLDVAGAILSASPHAASTRDRQQRTAADLVVDSSLSSVRCRAALAALGISAGEAKRRCRKATPPTPLPPRYIDGACGSVEEEGARWWIGDAAAKGQGADMARRCDIPVVETLDAGTFIHDHLVAGRPVLVTRAMEHARLCTQWTRKGFVASHGDVLLSEELYPYARASAHLYGHPVAALTPAARLVEAIRANLSKRGDGGDESGGDSGRQHGVFCALSGWSRIPYRGDGTEERTAHGDVRMDTTLEELPREDPARLLSHFERPPFVEDEQWLLRTDTIQFYLGGAYSGAQPHWHANAWNWLVHGRKRWFLWPPSKAAYSQRHVLDTLVPHAETAGRMPHFPRGQKPLVCEQHAGEVLFVPQLWGHATVNLQPSIGWASELIFDRGYDDGLGSNHGDEWWRTSSSGPSSAQYTSEEVSRDREL